MKNDNRIKFPSGLTVDQVKKRAKKTVKETGCNYNAALDLHATRNGEKLPFPQAVSELKQAQQLKPEDNAANIANGKKGTPGTSREYDQNQGSRGKQLNPNQLKGIVTFRVERGLLDKNFVAQHSLRKLSDSAAYHFLQSRKNRSTFFDWEVSHYHYIQFKKPIKGGDGNISGALQRIHSVMTGKLKFRQHPYYWIGQIQHTDKEHPEETYPELEYCPAIDGY